MLIDGEPVHLRAYKDALDRKINLVSQEIQVIPKSTIAENIMLDKIERFTRRGAIDWKRLEQDAQRYIDLVELNLPATTVVSGLSAAQKQLIMIARALSADARFLILDEPTSALTRHETDNLLQLLLKIRDEGVTVIFVSHKLEEVLEIADKVSVLRDGNLAGTRTAAGLTKEEIVKLMIGRAARTLDLGHLNVDMGQVVLEARQIAQPGTFRDAEFCAAQGRNPRFLWPGRLRAHRAGPDFDRRGAPERRRSAGQRPASPRSAAWPTACTTTEWATFRRTGKRRG